MNKTYDRDSTIDFWDAINDLLSNIKKDYSRWSDWDEGIERFNAGVTFKNGKKY